jgi:hypothetical protein
MKKLQKLCCGEERAPGFAAGSLENVSELRVEKLTANAYLLSQ